LFPNNGENFMRLISKVIVGAAVAGACGYAAAATITPPTAGDPVSRQGALVAGATTVSNVSVNILLQDTYSQFDTIRISPTNGLFMSADVANAHSASFICSGAGGNSVVFNLTPASSSPSLLVYTAETPNGPTAGSGASCPIGSVGFRLSSLTTIDNVQVQSVSRKSNLVTFDSASAVTVASVAEQFTVTVSQALNGVIDVSSSRLTFASNTDAVTGITASATVATYADRFSVSFNRVPTRNSITAATIVLTLTAGTSFAFLQEPDGQTGAGSCSTALGTGVATSATAGGALGTISMGTASTGANSGACNVMTVSFGSADPAGLYSVYLGRSLTPATTTNSTVFAPQSYTASVAVTGGTSGAIALGSLASTSAGSWTLNGTTVNIPYVPISSAINLSVLMANRSAQTGTVTFTAWNASGTSCTGTLGTINPTSQASFGSSLRAALQACTGTGWAGASGAVVQMLSTTPSADTEVHSAFTTSDGASRQVLINSTQGRGN
jgi:hypothetical protein